MLQRELFSLNPVSLQALKLVFYNKKVSRERMDQHNIPFKVLFALVKKRFLRFDDDYYTITIHGFDAIALNDLKVKGLIVLGDRIGTGKEADIYIGKLRIKSSKPVNLCEEKYDLNGNINTFYRSIHKKEEDLLEISETLKELTLLEDSDLNEEICKEIKERENEEIKERENEEIKEIKEISKESKIDFDVLCQKKETEINKVIYEENKEEEESFQIKLGGNIRNSIDIETVNKRHLQFTSLTKEKIENNRETLFFRKKREKVIDVVVKFHRLGRTSFRQVKNKRDYKVSGDWYTLSSKSASLESDYLNLLSDLCVPKFYLHSHHLVVMEYLEGYSILNNVDITDKEKVYNAMCHFLIALWEKGYVHGDFNEFNVLVNDNEEIRVIDFPQVVKKESVNALDYLIRDYEGINEYFLKKYKYEIKCEEIERIIEERKK